MKKWYSIQNLADSDEILIYDVIGKDFWGEGVGAEEFAKDMSAIKKNTINVRINSPGGSVMDGTAIYNTLVNHPAKINVYIDGWALSAASYIAMAGDHISMAENAMMMIHDPAGFSIGTAEEHRATADMQDKAKTTIIKTYQNQVNKDDKELSDMMSAETWMTADEALENGFVHEVTGAIKMTASFDTKMLKNYKHVPELLNNENDNVVVLRQFTIDGLDEKGVKAVEAFFNENQDKIINANKFVFEDDKSIEGTENNGRSISLLKKELQLTEID